MPNLFQLMQFVNTDLSFWLCRCFRDCLRAIKPSSHRSRSWWRDIWRAVIGLRGWCRFWGRKRRFGSKLWLRQWGFWTDSEEVTSNILCVIISSFPPLILSPSLANNLFVLTFSALLESQVRNDASLATELFTTVLRKSSPYHRMRKRLLGILSLPLLPSYRTLVDVNALAPKYFRL